MTTAVVSALAVAAVFVGMLALVGVAALAMWAVKR